VEKIQVSLNLNQNTFMGGYAGGLLNSITHIMVFNRVLVIQFDVRMILLYVTTMLLLLRHNNITPFMSRQYHSFYITTISLRNSPLRANSHYMSRFRSVAEHHRSVNFSHV